MSSTTTVAEHDDLIGQLERGSAVRDGEDGPGPVLEHALPQQRLGFDVERARQVVAHEQLGAADEHARRRRPLDLAARQTQAARPDRRGETVGHLGQVVVEHG